MWLNHHLTILKRTIIFGMRLIYLLHCCFGGDHWYCTVLMSHDHETFLYLVYLLCTCWYVREFSLDCKSATHKSATHKSATHNVNNLWILISCCCTRLYRPYVSQLWIYARLVCATLTPFPPHLSPPPSKHTLISPPLHPLPNTHRCFFSISPLCHSCKTSQSYGWAPSTSWTSSSTSTTLTSWWAYSGILEGRQVWTVMKKATLLHPLLHK